MPEILEPNKLKLWILRAVLEGNENAKAVYDYVCGCGYDGSDKNVMMNLKRYVEHGLIHRERVDGKYRYTPSDKTSDVHNYLELWEDEIIKNPTQFEKELMFWYQVSVLHFQRMNDPLASLMSLWFYETNPWRKRQILLAAEWQFMDDLKESDFDARYLGKLFDDILGPLIHLYPWMATGSEPLEYRGLKFP